MLKDIERPLGFNTRSLHAGYDPDATTHARAVPIYQSTSFTFDDTDRSGTASSLAEMRRLIGWGVDGMITDRLDIALTVI